MARRRKSRRPNPHPCIHQVKPTCQPYESCHELTSGIANKPSCVPTDHCRDESASCGDLRRRYLSLLDAQSLESTWKSVWHLFITHEWFQERLDRCARSVLRGSFLTDQWADDVKQEVIVKLASKLKRLPDLKMDRVQVETRFAGWLHTIILRDCRMAVRKLRRLHCRTLPLLKDPIADDPSTTLDARLDFQDALQELHDPELTAMLLYGQASAPCSALRRTCHGDEPHRRDFPLHDGSVHLFLDSEQRVSMFPNRDYQRATRSKLFDQRWRNMIGRRRDDNDIKGSFRLPSMISVAVAHVDILIAERAKPVFRSLGKGLDDFHTVDTLHKLRQHRGLIARPGSDVERLVMRLWIDQLRHQRDDIGLRNRLARPNWQG